MTREEAISIITKERDEDIFGCWTPYRKRIHEAFTLAIEALEGVCFDEWCDDCKEYDTEKNCCPRFNRVIRGAMNREPSENGTLEVKVEDATKIGRVLISDDEHRGGLYYPDEDEPQGDLISRAEAIEAITGTLDAIDHVPKWVFDKLTCAINILPLADRPKDGDLISRAEAIEALGEEPLVWCDEEYEIAERDQWRADVEAIKSVPSADRPRGEWVKEELIDAINDAQFVYDSDEGGHKEYDITELVRVIFKDIISNLSSADIRGEDE